MGLSRRNLAVIRRVWMDPSLTRGQQAACMGMTVGAWRQLARRLGLPHGRRGVRRTGILLDLRQFSRLWVAGVRGADIAAALGVSCHQVSRLRVRAGLAPRPGGYKGIALSALAEAELGRRMAEVGRAEEAARAAMDRRLGDRRAA